MKALSNNIVSNKNDKGNSFYLDTAIVVYITHDLRLYIISHLDDQTVVIETEDDIILKTQSARTIDLYLLVDNKKMLIELSNVQYLPELNTNLISLVIFEEKGCEFCAVDGFL